MRIRKNVWTLPAGDRALDWYAKAVAAMQALPITNPLGWRYQAAIHGYPGPQGDPFAKPGEPMPPSAEQETYWQQCQHSTSFFVSWHRMFLLHFERIVAAQVAGLGGPTDWALPYWDYSTRPEWRLLPEAFRNARLGDGTPNPLYVAARNADANAGRSFLHKYDVDVSACLRAPAGTTTSGFFGPPPANHSGGAFGALESTPHNQVHVQAGSDAAGGWMLDPDLAALDPIFWLHHSNIDRLWEVWLRRDPAHRNLTTPYWLTGVSFDFHDATGAPVTMQSQEVLDMTKPPLDYQYEDTSDPLAPAPSAQALVGAEAQHELVGATLGSVDLADDTVHAHLPTPVSPAAFRQFARTPTSAPSGLQHVTLRLENVTSTHPGPMYDVYLNVPEADRPDQHEDLHVGRAAMFGVAQASKTSAQHGGSGQTFAFDITELYNRLSAAGAVDPKRLRVSFVPVRASKNAPVRVGRVSLYFG
jgi:tyrosinase